jgi:uncharacterized protein YdaT
MENKETVNEPIITIDNEEYKESDLNQEQKYFVSQIQESRSKRVQLQRKVDRNTAVINSFEKALIESTKKVSEEILKKEK